MKKVLFCLVCVCVLVGCSTPMYFLHPQTVDKVYEYPGLSKNDIYVRANQWFVENFVSVKEVIQFADKEGGIITGKYTESIGVPTKSLGVQTVYSKSVKFLITVRVKSGAMNVQIKDIDAFWTAYEKLTAAMEQAINEREASWEASLNEYIKNYTAF